MGEETRRERERERESKWKHTNANGMEKNTAAGRLYECEQINNNKSY